MKTKQKTRRTVMRIGTFQAGSFGVYPAGNLRGDELMNLWAVEPDHSRHASERSPALPTGRFLFASRAAARSAAEKLDRSAPLT